MKKKVIPPIILSNTNLDILLDLKAKPSKVNAEVLKDTNKHKFGYILLDLKAKPSKVYVSPKSY